MSAPGDQGSERPMWTRALRRATLVGAMAAIAGCMIPVSIIERATPPLAGELRRSDGTPVEGEQLVVSTSGGRDACAPDTLVATTDSSGAFQAPGSTHRLRWLILIPPIERFVSGYSLCRRTVEGTLVEVYRGFSSLDPEAPGDSLVCLAWEWEGDTRYTCSATSPDREWVERTIRTGGRWSSGDAAGSYRLILTETEPRKGWDGTFPRPRLAVQWIEDAPPGAPTPVHATLMLPGDDEFRTLRRLWEPRLWEVADRWCLSLESHRERGFIPGSETLWYELGAPGEARRVPGCLQTAPR